MIFFFFCLLFSATVNKSLADESSVWRRKRRDGGGVGWWENGIRARLKGAESRWDGGGWWELESGRFMGGWRGMQRNNRKWGHKETRATGGRLDSAGDELCNISQAFISLRLREGWRVFFFLLIWSAASNHKPLRLVASSEFHSDWGRREHSRKRKKSWIFLILFLLPSLLCNLKVPWDHCLFFFFRGKPGTPLTVCRCIKTWQSGEGIRNKITETKQTIQPGLMHMQVTLVWTSYQSLQFTIFSS